MVFSNPRISKLEGASRSGKDECGPSPLACNSSLREDGLGKPVLLTAGGEPDHPLLLSYLLGFSSRGRVVLGASLWDGDALCWS